MTRAEEAGQPVRPATTSSPPDGRKRRRGALNGQQAPERADAADSQRPAWLAVSEEEAEVLDQEIGDADLVRPGDRAEAARVESARRRLADLVLVRELTAAGFRGVAFDVFVTELAAYGIAALMAWMRTGQIVRQCAAKGRPIPGGLPDQWSRDDRLEIAIETTARALKYFTGDVLRSGKWKPGCGASLKTFFVGSCILQFPNVYNVWRNEQRSWNAIEILEPGTEDGVMPTAPGACWSDPTAEDIIRRQLMEENLDAIKDPQTRKAAKLVMDGYPFAEAGEAAGLSAAAVEGRLYRLRRRLR